MDKHGRHKIVSIRKKNLKYKLVLTFYHVYKIEKLI